jgi:hypothetical protein
MKRPAASARKGRRRFPLRFWDAVIIAVVLGLSGGLAWYVYADKGGTPYVRIKGADGEWHYPLDRDREITVAGPLGPTRIVIAHGEVRIADSPCPGKNCVHAGAVSRPGGCIACLPNRVLVTVEGRSEAGYDAESH